MQKLFLAAGALSGALSVMIGAFGSHGLRKYLESVNRGETFEIAVKYQFYHSFALLILGLLMFKVSSDLLNYAGYLFIGGILVFSGSLYILCLTNVGKWGAVTPFGGTMFIIAWVLMLIAVLKA
ncbi:MAG TPA: DUF423 domain-containing protein [Cytophagaceae bacterium]